MLTLWFQQLMFLINKTHGVRPHADMKHCNVNFERKKLTKLYHRNRNITVLGMSMLAIVQIFLVREDGLPPNSSGLGEGAQGSRYMVGATSKERW